MKIPSTALQAMHSCASGYRWFARRFKGPAEDQGVIEALVADGRVDDACWLLDPFGPIKSVLVVDAISAPAFVHAGSVQLRGEVDVDAVLRTGGSLNAGGSVRAGAGFSLYAGLSARRDPWPSCGRVVSRARPETLLSGFWDRVPCGASA